MELFVFIVAGAMVIGGALGVILRAHPVHAALSLVLTLFGVAVLFVAQEAHFLAAVQVIVYAGAIVVLILFVIMLLGVDRADNLRIEPLRMQRPIAVVIGLGTVALVIVALLSGGEDSITGARSVGEAAAEGEENINALARSLFSDYVFAFEVTSVLLIIAVVATVVLARRPPRPDRLEQGEAAGEREEVETP
jgi:NADH-quinone oxidoreductase subunit J